MGVWWVCKFLLAVYRCTLRFCRCEYPSSYHDGETACLDDCCASPAGLSSPLSECHATPQHLGRPWRHDMPPPALKSNLSDDERVMTVVAILVCTLTALVVTSQRGFVRAKIIQKLGWDVGWRPPLPVQCRVMVV